MNKKAQEEIVGFAMIMVIIAIVFLVFLGIGIRSGSSDSIKGESIDIRHFLESTMEFTTECSASVELDFLEIGELFEKCLENNVCLNGDSACDVLENDLKEIFDNSWSVGPDGAIKGYEFDSSYIVSNSTEDVILSMSKGDCENTILRGASVVSPAFPGTIRNSLKLCS